MSAIDVIVAPGQAVTVAGTCYRQGERLACPVVDASRWLAEGLVLRPQATPEPIGQAHDLADQVRTGLDIALASLPDQPAAETTAEAAPATEATPATEPPAATEPTPEPAAAPATEPAPEPTPVQTPAPPAKSGRAKK